MDDQRTRQTAPEKSADTAKRREANSARTRRRRAAGDARLAEIVPYQFNTHQVRTVARDGQIWFVAEDVCRILGLVNLGQSLDRLDTDERSKVQVQTGGIGRWMAIINESGLFALILTSNKPEARKFRRWVTSDVLPSIRKTGSYTVPNGDPAMDHSDIADIINRKNGMYVVVIENNQRRMQESDGTEIINIVNNALSTMMAGALIDAQGALTFSIPEGLLLGTDNGFASWSLRQAVGRGADVASRYLKVSRFRADESDAVPGGLPR